MLCHVSVYPPNYMAGMVCSLKELLPQNNRIRAWVGIFKFKPTINLPEDNATRFISPEGCWDRKLTLYYKTAIIHLSYTYWSWRVKHINIWALDACNEVWEKKLLNRSQNVHLQFFVSVTSKNEGTRAVWIDWLNEDCMQSPFLIWNKHKLYLTEKWKDAC